MPSDVPCIKFSVTCCECDLRASRKPRKSTVSKHYASVTGPPCCSDSKLFKCKMPALELFRKVVSYCGRRNPNLETHKTSAIALFGGQNSLGMCARLALAALLGSILRRRARAAIATAHWLTNTTNPVRKHTFCRTLQDRDLADVLTTGIALSTPTK